MIYMLLIKKITTVGLAVLLSATFIHAQNKQSGAQTLPSGLKAYTEVITSKAITSKGLFTVHKVDDKYYFEIPDSIFARDIMAVSRFSKTPSASGIYGGELANQSVMRFEKGPDHKVFLRSVLNIINSPDSSKPMFKAVQNSNIEPIVQAFDIKAINKDTSGVIIDVTDFFKGDNQIVSISPARKRRLSLSSLSSDRTYIESIKTFPINTEIKTVKTFTAISASNIPGSGPSPNPVIPAAQEAGTITLEMNTSLVILPVNPVKRRMHDSRVGYFADDMTIYEENSQRSKQNIYIVRWKLEPKEEDIEKYKRGELVVPKKQIVYYIDPATPKQWQPYLIQGINDWQKAFEKAGFKNAIVGKEWPENDSMSLEDARFSVIRYFASNIENAYGPNIHDPRSGEILESHIGWYHNVMKILRNWYFVQCAAVDTAARNMKFDNELMGQLIRFVSSHEIGHTLGLRHNMGSSSKTPVEKLRDKNWLKTNGHTASIMDYARFNYVAQPEDSISRENLFPRIGDYDNWAIEWGYRWNDLNDEADKKWSNKIIIDKVKNPRLWFGGEGQTPDARSQTEDLGDNSMKASEYGLRNLKYIMSHLTEWTQEEGDRYENLTELYNQLIVQFKRYINHVTKNVGSYYETFKSVEETGDVYEITPKATQKEAINWLAKNIFETPTWALDKNILNKITAPADDAIITLQDAALANLLNTARMNRMVVASARDNNAYGLDEMLSDVKKAVWSELVTKKPTDMHRRNLQKSYVNKLSDILGQAKAKPAGSITISVGSTTNPDIKNSDIPSIVRGNLVQLQNEIKVAVGITTDRLTKLHLQDVAERIKEALNPK